MKIIVWFLSTPIHIWEFPMPLRAMRRGGFFLLVLHSGARRTGRVP
ncbi:hypothetical protein [Aneurinibacillus migulanus]|nr:hypothetical protein [Aneurinibacillus migulanus]